MALTLDGTTGISATGNITGGNVIAIGSLIVGSFAPASLVTAGNVTGGNLLTVGLISAVGSITSAGNLSLTGNIVGAGTLWINTTSNGNINLNPNGSGQTNIPAGILSVTGNIVTAADVTAQNVNSLSDQTLKDNITQLNDTRSIINQLSGVAYDWKNGTGHSYGLIAQDVEKILPNAVKTNDSGLKSVNYNMIIPFLIETIKKLDADVEELKKKIKS